MFGALNRDQKEAVGLLQMGTFLEYFDLMLYVHMAVFLNDIFFPKSDPHTGSLLAAFAFCSSYILRPFGALIFGYIGDNMGRKATIILTTILMSVSCLVMANLPTYAQIGITAAWAVTLCRMVQGISSMGEMVGAEIYLTEITKPPYSYVAVGLVAVAGALGSSGALVVATITTNYNIDWRIAFWIGALIAVVGSMARTRLRETPDFVDMQRRVKTNMDEARLDGLGKLAEALAETQTYFTEKPKHKTLLAYFLIYCTWPVCFYFIYIYCGEILKNKFGYTGADVIYNNLFVSLTGALSCFVFAISTLKLNPLTLLKVKFYAFVPVILVYPFILSSLTEAWQIFLFQNILCFFALTHVPASPIFLSYFPVYRRFTYASYLYAGARAIMYIITSFGLIYLNEAFGDMGLLVLMVPVSLGFLWSVHHFEKLEERYGCIPLQKKSRTREFIEAQQGI